MEQKSSRFYHSITFQFIVVLFLLVLPIVFLSCIINYQFMRNGMKQVEEAHTEVLKTYILQVDHDLDLAENYMNSLIFYNGTTVYLTNRASPNFYYAANQLNSEIAKTALYYQYISGFFLYVPDTDFCYTYFTDNETMMQGNTIRSYIRDTFAAEIRNDTGWHWVEINGISYLIQGFYSNGIYGGSLMNVNQMSETAGKNIAFASNKQFDAVLDRLPENRSLTHAQSAKCSLILYEILDEEETLSSLPFLQRYFTVITLVMLLLIALLFFALQCIVLRPLHRLADAMHLAETGELDAHIEENCTKVLEFQQINRAFNRMTQEMKRLKIAVYEEQLETDKIKLQNLSYQIRPHFMINSLNMAYNMVVSGSYEAAAKLMRFSANYMRYLLRLEDDFVPLQEELQHLKDYLGIQMLRYEGQFDYEFTVDPFVEDIEIPSMILQNFIENSIKYSIHPHYTTLIQLIIDYKEINNVPYVSIIVRDNGKGYPDWLLDALREKDLDLLRDRVGLRNTIQRIEILYGERAKCSFYNKSGAVNAFLFPLEYEEEPD